MPHINIEIKARHGNISKVREVLKLEKAVFKGTDHQIDTYFNVNFGRLKLREGNIENYLIYYDRQNKTSPKQSNVILYEVTSGSSLKELLTKALGILVEVDKHREIYFIDNVKFHLDKVKDLGSFIEIEAIDKEGRRSKDELLEQCNHYLAIFDIPEEDLIDDSYSDLLLKR